MSTRWSPARDIKQLIAELPEIQASEARVAATIARGTSRNAKDHRYRPVVEVNDGRVRVVTYYSFAHLDEWGSIHNPPTGAMRRSASTAGRFVPSDKA